MPFAAPSTNAARPNDRPAAAPAASPSLRVGAVLLAAGAASRLGGRPKCLLQRDGLPLIRHALAALEAAGVTDTVVVLGHHGARIESALAGCAAARVRNPRPEAGLASSQRIGLATLPGGHDAVIMALCDQPLLTPRHVAALLAAWRARPPGCSVVFPVVDGQPGNPVILGAEVREQILAGDARVGCREWRDAHPAAVSPWVSTERAYRVDIDTPEDLLRYERETGQALTWPTDDALRAAPPDFATPAARHAGQGRIRRPQGTRT